MTRLWLGLVTLVDCFSRIIVRMANYNQTTQEIARPSELLMGITAYTTSLQSLSSYINVDVTRLVKSILLQQTRPQDARGAQTITTLYTNWCACHILYSIPFNTYISNRSAVIAHENEVVCANIVYLFLLLSVLSLFQPFCFLLCESYCAHTVFDFCLSGSWRACYVKPATLSSSTALLCNALSTRAQTMSQVSERRSFQM